MFRVKKYITNSFKFLFVLMPLKMPALCLQTLQPLCYRGTHHFHGDPCSFYHEGSLQTVQGVVMLLARLVLQNSPQFVLQGVEVWTPRRPILGSDKYRNVPPQPVLIYLGIVGRSWVAGRLISDHWRELCYEVSQLLVEKSSWYTWAPVFTPLSQKWRNVTPWWYTPTNPWHRKGDGLSAPLEPSRLPHRMCENKSCRSGICLLLEHEDFLVEEDVFMPILRGDALFFSVRSPSKGE